MLTRSARLLVRRDSVTYLGTQMPRLRGYYPEDNSNDYNTALYTHPEVMRVWYTRHERYHAARMIAEQRKTESQNHNNGLHFSGDGAFERELTRKGVQVDKYPLPSTVGVRRVHEMTVLRRQALRKEGDARLSRLRDAKAVDAPTWMDETDGPVNPHFLAMCQRNYKQPLQPLPRRPMTPTHS
jgi:hypothetical protein